ncbi:hypothetical protein EMIHUDRAFT_237969 [Emiliania huxleyi CCMP1516]|uniref:Uncharacterized protein n=2 Tax=Emiliania huxleyi TaxID=2903 RepID=A0A0D3JND5_EMIH1|nr:hypothetical protein EMIHUDRAFT_237969 [Emiliania huxleyi CCMP1516]EOD25020.1 hypothetical protein EMIHUDRAFT_237969 [Emiliania huxleyi CCMP1516]|eukprot:XP_005777449.1 hypothetical protein EMIHUDRAFT_237969 [Emiliania huxleyi CCMP1516]
MASHRIGARVAGLSPEQLCAIIEAQAGASDAALRVAEEHAARLVEQPEWILSEVLLSPDLAPHILAHLPTKEHAAKASKMSEKACLEFVAAPQPARAAGTHRSRVRHTRKYAAERATDGVPAAVMECET